MESNKTQTDEKAPRGAGCLVALSLIGFLLSFIWLLVLKAFGCVPVFPLLFLLLALLTASLCFALSWRRLRYAKRLAALSLFPALPVGLLFVGGMYDSPTNYSRDTVASMEKRVAEDKRSPHNNDPDRWWTYDRDRTVLALFLLRERNRRWPDSLNELLDSGFVADKACVKPFWRLSVTPSGWELWHDPSNRMMALWRQPDHSQ